MTESRRDSRILIMVTKALFVRLEAKAGKETEVADFLKHGLPIAAGETGTVAWLAIQFGPSTFGVFDAFTDDVSRDAHLEGKISEVLWEKASDLLVAPPTIEKLDILAAKLP